MPVMPGAASRTPGLWLHSAAARTRASTSSRDEVKAVFSLGSTGARSRMTKATSASGCASGGASDAVPLPGADSASSFCGLNAGMLADASGAASERLPATRTKGRTRTISWLPTRVMVETRIS